MSYILNALRKSDAERQHGQLPDHLQQPTLLVSQRKQKSLWPVLVVVLLLVNLAGIAYLVSAGGEEAKPIVLADGYLALESEDASKQGAASVGAEQAPGEGDEFASASDDIPVTSSGSASRLSAVRDQLQPSVSGNHPAIAETTVGTTQQNRAGSLQDRGLKISKAPPPAEGEIGRQTARSAGSTPENSIDRGAVSPTSAASLSQGGETAFSAVEEPSHLESKTGAPFIGDLPREFRSRVPDLRFNSHIYANEADRRRVMINDHYLREGESFQGLIVTEITEQGVILEMDSQRFRVPVVRDWTSQ